MDLVPLGKGNGSSIILSNKPDKVAAVFERYFYRLVAICDLFRWINYRIRKFEAGQPPGDPREIGAKNAALRVGRSRATMAGMALETFVNGCATQGIASSRIVAEDEAVQLLIAALRRT